MPNVIAKLVSITGCLSFPSQSPTVIHFDNCHTANQVMWNSIITDWLLHQPGWVGDASVSAGSWLSHTICLTTHLLPNLEPIHWSALLIRYASEQPPPLKNSYFWNIPLHFRSLLKITPNPFPTVSTPFQISITWQIKDESLADKRKTYLLNNSPD